MVRIYRLLSSIIGKGRTFKLLFNLSPMYRGTGGRLMNVTDDLMNIKIKLPMNYRTKNYVGTLYGGHMYSAVDGIYMVQLKNILGKSYVVWDKTATIRFRKPGNQTLFAVFNITADLILQIKNDVKNHQEKDFTLRVNLVDSEATIYAEIEKVIYIANLDYYLKKRGVQPYTKVI